MPEQRYPNTAYTFFSWCSCCEKYLPPSRFLIRFHICRTWKNTKACLTLPRLLGNILWADETEVQLFRSFVSCYMWHKTSKAFHNKNMTTAKHGGGDAVWWSEAALLLQDLAWLAVDLIYSWILLSNRKSWRRMSVHSLKLKSTQVKQQWHGVWSQTLTLTRLRCFDITVNRLFRLKHPPMWLNDNNTAWKSRLKIPPQRCERLTVSFQKCMIAVFATRNSTNSY